MDWKAIKVLQGIRDLRRVALELKLRLDLPGAPPVVTLRVLEMPSGQFEASLSHLPVLGAATKKPLAPARPTTPALARPASTALARPAARSTTAKTTRTQPDTAGPFVCVDEALDYALRHSVQMAHQTRCKTWEPNPEFEP